MARLKAVVESGSDADALRAIEQWMSRVFGRPVDPITMMTPDSLDLSQLTTASLKNCASR